MSTSFKELPSIRLAPVLAVDTTADSFDAAGAGSTSSGGVGAGPSPNLPTTQEPSGDRVIRVGGRQAMLLLPYGAGSGGVFDIRVIGWIPTVVAAQPNPVSPPTPDWWPMFLGQWTVTLGDDALPSTLAQGANRFVADDVVPDGDNPDSYVFSGKAGINGAWCLIPHYGCRYLEIEFTKTTATHMNALYAWTELAPLR